MRNFAKYWIDINNIPLNDIAMDKRTMKICKCSDGNYCNNCLFSAENYPESKERCYLNLMDWLNSEYVEPKRLPEVDWSKVAVDTPILVRDTEKQEWKRRYFAKYVGGTVCTWCCGSTSWSTESGGTIGWKYAKLAEDGGDDNGQRMQHGRKNKVFCVDAKT